MCIHAAIVSVSVDVCTGTETYIHISSCFVSCADFKIHNLLLVFFFLFFFFCLEKVCGEDSATPGRKHILFIVLSQFYFSHCFLLESTLVKDDFKVLQK